MSFLPYFQITIECAQVRDAVQRVHDTWIPVEAGEVKPFWPATGDTKKMLMTCRLDNTTVSAYFPLYESNSVLLKIENRVCESLQHS